MLEAMQNRIFKLNLCLRVMIVWSGLGFSTVTLQADDWMMWPSTYTHDPQFGRRVDQYAIHEQPLAPYREDFSRSGFRHFRSTLQAGQSADNMHIVEQWGRQIVPYEQWRFPFRPYGVPYDAWGPQTPYGIVNSTFGFGGIGYPAAGSNYGGNGNPHPGSTFPSYNNPAFQVPNGSRGFPLTPTYNNEPWYDGTYPSAPPLNQR